MKLTWWLLPWLLSAAGPAYAQHAKIEAAKLPLTGQRAADFVPPGWRVEKRIGGDLNADQRPDSVLVLVEKPEAGRAIKDDAGTSRNRALLVLLVQPAGTLKRVGVGATALYCTTCFPQQDYTETGTPTISMKQGDMLVKHVTGSSRMLLQTQHYRYETSTARMRLVGEDYNRLDQLSVQFVSTTTNFLTRRQRIRRGRKKQAVAEQKPETRAVKVPRLYLEDIDLPNMTRPWLPYDFFD